MQATCKTLQGNNTAVGRSFLRHKSCSLRDRIAARTRTTPDAKTMRQGFRLFFRETGVFNRPPQSRESSGSLLSAALALQVLYDESQFGDINFVYAKDTEFR